VTADRRHRGGPRPQPHSPPLEAGGGRVTVLAAASTWTVCATKHDAFSVHLLKIFQPLTRSCCLIVAIHCKVCSTTLAFYEHFHDLAMMMLRGAGGQPEGMLARGLLGKPSGCSLSAPATVKKGIHPCTSTFVILCLSSLALKTLIYSNPLSDI
jgi:hypothetical protein